MTTTTVRAKFKVHIATPFTDQAGQPRGYKVALSPVYDSNPDSENGKFYQATPWGEIVLGTMNPAAAAAFTPGAEFFVDFTPAN